MTDQAKTMLSQSAPWKKGVGWPIILIQGVILLGVGIYILAQPDTADNIVRQLIAAVLVVNGLLSVFAGFRLPQAPTAPWRILRGGIAATVGVIVSLEHISDYLDADASRFILAIGGLVYGVLGLVEVVATREDRGLRIGGLIGSGVWIVLAFLFFTGDETDNTRMNLLGVIAALLGLLLLAYAFYLYRLKQASPAATTEPSVTADSTA